MKIKYFLLIIINLHFTIVMSMYSPMNSYEYIIIWKTINSIGFKYKLNWVQI